MMIVLFGEWMKLHRQRLFYVLMAVLFALSVANGAYQKYGVKPETASSDNWEAQVQRQLDSLKTTQEELRPGTLMYEVNQEDILIHEYRLEHHLKPENERSAWHFVRSNQLLLSLIGLYIISFGAYTLAAEYQQGTIKALFLKPTSRASFLHAKFAMIPLLTVTATAFLLLVSLLIGYVLFGFGGSDVRLIVSDGTVVEQSLVQSTLRYWALAGLELSIMAALAYTISALVKHSAISIAVSLFIYFSAGMATRLLATKLEVTRYVLFANTDFNVYFEGAPLIKGMTLAFSAAVTAAYLAVFWLISYRSINGRDVPLS
ncbi:ABC transporter permease [Paenibacillus kobensis]|uniref:ABC transporter permease n=1 Tax=Paenibacillus kobensis TaxID=59841 RepID=UPI0013E39851|nr:ABC transporter permease [Paenibacillus kobensis]